MTGRRFLFCLLVLTAAGTCTACTRRRVSEETAKRDQLAHELAAIDRTRAALRQARLDLAVTRSELGSAAMVAEARRSAEENARIGALKSRLATLESSTDTQFDDLQARLAGFLTMVLNDFPNAPETAQGLRIYADEAMAYADDAVGTAGDYKGAIDQLELAGGYFEQIGLPPYQPLVARLAMLEEARYITRERFDQLRPGMTPEQVKGVAGVPYYRNVNEDPERRLVTWTYPRRDGGAAEVRFATGRVSGMDFDGARSLVPPQGKQ